MWLCPAKKNVRRLLSSLGSGAMLFALRPTENALHDDLRVEPILRRPGPSTLADFLGDLGLHSIGERLQRLLHLAVARPAIEGAGEQIRSELLIQRAKAARSLAIALIRLLGSLLQLAQPDIQAHKLSQNWHLFGPGCGRSGRIYDLRSPIFQGPSQSVWSRGLASQLLQFSRQSL